MPVIGQDYSILLGLWWPPLNSLGQQKPFCPRFCMEKFPLPEQWFFFLSLVWYLPQDTLPSGLIVPVSAQIFDSLGILHFIFPACSSVIIKNHDLLCFNFRNKFLKKYNIFINPLRILCIHTMHFDHICPPPTPPRYTFLLHPLPTSHFLVFYNPPSWTNSYMNRVHSSMLLDLCPLAYSALHHSPTAHW